MRVHVLGAGLPTPTANRFGSAFVVQLDDEYIMFDCGPAATDKLVKAGLWPTKISHLFFTHHHFDHNADYGCFVLTRWDQQLNHDNDLSVFGPPPTSLITESLIGENGVFACDWNARIHHESSKRVYVNRGGVLPRQPPRVLTHDVGPGLIHHQENWEVVADTAVHVQPYLDSLAYRINTPQGSVVFTGDTELCDSVVNLAKGANVLVGMCWDEQESIEASGETQSVSGTIAMATMAQAAGVRIFAPVHCGPFVSDPVAKARADAQIKAIFDGEVIWAPEVSSFDVH